RRELHAPQIIFLLGVVVMHGVQRHLQRMPLNWSRQRKRGPGRGEHGLRDFSVRRRDPGRLVPCFPNQLKQMMIFDVLDLVGEYYKPPIYIIQLPTLELISELLATQAERVPS